MTLTLAARRAIRTAAFASRSNLPIEIVDGDTAPIEVGSGWHYTTKGGTHISHPSAYSRQGWSNMIYHASTRRIEVGRAWIARHFPGAFEIKAPAESGVHAIPERVTVAA